MSVLTPTSRAAENPGEECPRCSRSGRRQKILKLFVKSQLTQWQHLMIYKGATLPLQTAMVGSLQRPGSNANHTSASQVFTESQRWASSQVWTVILAARDHPTPSLSLIHSFRGLLNNSLDLLEEKSKMSTGLIHWTQAAAIILSSFHRTPTLPTTQAPIVGLTSCSPPGKAKLIQYKVHSG